MSAFMCYDGKPPKQTDDLRKKLQKKIVDWSHFWPKWRDEYLIRMCWEISVSLWAIESFHVYTLHMHGVQSSETRNPFLHIVAEKGWIYQYTGRLHLKVEVWVSSKHMFNIWGLNHTHTKKSIISQITEIQSWQSAVWDEGNSQNRASSSKRWVNAAPRVSKSTPSHSPEPGGSDVC